MKKNILLSRNFNHLKFPFFLSVFASLIFLGISLPGCTKKDAGIWRSSDSGETWTQKVKVDEKHQLSSLNVLKLVFDPQDAKKLYWGSQAKGMYLSQDGGDTWQATKIASGDVWDIAIDPDNNKIIYAAVFDQNLGRVYRTEDGGENWEMVFVDTLPGFPVYNVLLDWYSHNIIISTGWGGVLQSEDQGKTWAKIAEISAKLGRMYIDHNDSRILWYVTPGEGIFKTEDAGITWTEIALENLKQYNGFSHIYEMTIDNKTGTFYLATDYGLLISSDQGKTWQPIKTLTPFQSVPFYAVAVNPNASDEIMFAAGNTLFKSVNQGESWRVRKVYTGNIIRTIKYKPDQPEIIYVGIRTLK